MSLPTATTAVPGLGLWTFGLMGNGALAHSGQDRAAALRLGHREPRRGLCVALSGPGAACYT